MAEYRDHQELIGKLRSLASREDLESSKEYAQNREYLDRLFSEVCSGELSAGTDRDFLRVAHWNIEKGKYLDDVISAFRNHPVLKAADLISINEADVGMIRSGQRFVARELGEALGMNWAFAPGYLEFSKGYGDDLEMAGENTIALQGNAVLSRYPLRNSRVVELPVCYDHFSHVEKRIGNRNGLVVEVITPAGKLQFATAHLEVRNAPSCRSKQIRAVIDAIELEGPALVAGDFNSNTFARGGRMTTLKGFARIILSDANKLKESLRQPQAMEPLFAELRKFGFTDEGLNDGAVTCFVPMTILEDSSRLPAFLASAVNRQMERYEGRLDFRLDWFIGRKVRVLGEGEVRDQRTGAECSRPLTITGLRRADGSLISDHDPITVDIGF